MDYDNSGQDTSNYNDTYNNNESNSYLQDSTRQDNYESQQHHETQDHYSFTKENDSPKIPISKSVEFILPSSNDDRDDDTSDLIDIQKDCESHESTPNNENGNYENAIIDHFESAFVNSQKDGGPTNGNGNRSRNDNSQANQNNILEKDDIGCCGCNGGPLMCFAFMCDCFGM